MNATALIADYCAAYEAMHDSRPHVVQIGKRHRFRVVNHNGDASDFTARDLENVTRGLRHLAAKMMEGA